MKLSKEQKEAIRKVVGYSIEEERTHLEVHIATMFGVDATEMTDKELYGLCLEKGIDHIWLSCHILDGMWDNPGTEGSFTQG